MKALMMGFKRWIFRVVCFFVFSFGFAIGGQDGFIVDAFGQMKGCRDFVSLDGEWEFKIDANNEGYDLGWQKGKGDFDRKIEIPGVPQAQGIGEKSERQKNYFWGAFWIRKYFMLKDIQANQKVWLKIGGIFPAGEVYINGKIAGYTKSNRTAMRIDVTELVLSGGKNLIAIKVCDLPEIRLDGLWESPSFGKNWSGLYRSISLEITNRVCVTDIYIQPMFDKKAVEVELSLSENSSEPIEVDLSIKDGERKIAGKRIKINAGENSLKTRIAFENFTAWSINKPKLYTLYGEIGRKDKFEHKFGMRKLIAKGRKFYLNDEPIFLKVFGDDHYYVETLMPPANKQWYIERLERAKKYGFNAVKSCSDIITEEYMQAADKIGLMVIQEMPFGVETLRENKNNINKEFQDYYTKELENIVRMSRNHPCVVSYSMTSELNFWRQSKDSFKFFNQFLVARTRELDKDAIVTDGTGYIIPKRTKFGVRNTDWCSKGHLFRDVFDELEIEKDNEHPCPVVLHEYNWWSCYPDPSLKSKYAKSQYNPYWYKQLYESAKKNGQEDIIETCHENSVWLQKICRKEGIEYARRAGVEGYILWLLIDLYEYSEGLFDDWWRPKNVTAEDFLQSNGDTVVILGEDKSRCFEMGEIVEIPLAVSHYGTNEIESCDIKCVISSDEKRLSSGILRTDSLAKGRLSSAGSVKVKLPLRDVPYKFKLRVEISNQGKKINSNQWDFWAFEEIRAELSDLFSDISNKNDSNISCRFFDFKASFIGHETKLLITDMVDEKLMGYLRDGGRCILLSHDSKIENKQSDCDFFRTIPWNRGFSGNSGTVISQHPSLEKFPHESRCDLQFVELIKGVYPIEIDRLKEYGVKPIIRAIDHYKSNKNKAYLLEFNVFKGKVLATSLAIRQKFATNIEARYLLQCLIDYALSDGFRPESFVLGESFLQYFEKKPETSD